MASVTPSLCVNLLYQAEMSIDTGLRIQSEKGTLVGGALRKRPSVLSLTPVSPIQRFETPDSARSFSSESSQSKPSWARPLHLVRSPWILRLLHGDDTHSLSYPRQDHLRQDLQYIAPVHIENLLHLLLIHFLIPTTLDLVL